MPTRFRFSAIVMAVLVVTAPAFAEHEPIRPHDMAMMSAALTLMAMDLSTSLDIRRVGDHGTLRWVDSAYTSRSYRYDESDPLIVGLFGDRPSDLQFAAFFTGFAASAVGTWYVLPERWRWIVPVYVGVVEGYCVAHNLHAGLTFAF